MNIYISNADGSPIYQQIVDQVKAQIISRELKEGEALPSHAASGKGASDQRDHHQAAYEELEREGFLVSYTGKGSFVAAAQQRAHKRAEKKGRGGLPGAGGKGGHGPAAWAFRSFRKCWLF